jgi:quercetin dioxygenase-like cupin family protein
VPRTPPQTEPHTASRSDCSGDNGAMEAQPYRWDDVATDNPIPLLFRRRIEGEQMLLARVHLEKGCVVPQHRHVSEQFAVVLSGHVRWTVDGNEIDMRGGEVLLLPSNVEHGLITLEDTEIIDILSPPGPMGVDAHTKTSDA